MMAGVVAGRAGKKVLIVEKNKDLGAKLKITGGGRCNIFNAEYDVRALLKNYGPAEKYLYAPFSVFGVAQTEAFFKELGIDIKVEDRKRAFPKSEKATDVCATLVRELEKNGVEIRLKSSVEKILFENNTVSGVQIKNDSQVYVAKKYVLATGGYSHPETGSTGDGFAFLKGVPGVSVHEASPSLVPVSVSDALVKRLSGKAIENIKITFFVDGVKKKVLKFKSPSVDALPGAEKHKNAVALNRVLCTHFGLSGPTILNTSKEISNWLKEGRVEVVFDLFPQYDEKQLDTHILSMFEGHKNMMLKNALNTLYPGNIIQEILLDMPGGKALLDTKVHSITVAQRKHVIQTIKNVRVHIDALMGFDKAIIADGGVVVHDVDFDTMALKKVPNLYVTGDMLNINRPSGGYSLQLCWTTGFIAGSSVK